MTSLIQQNVPLKDKNWFHTGGPARFFCQPQDETEFQQALTFAQQEGMAVTLIGQGANILISDDGIDGLVIQPALQQLTFEKINEHETLVHAGAGISFEHLINQCLNHNVLGLEEFSGIPGSVGGSVFINIHYYEFLLSDFLIQARVINKKTGQCLTVDKQWFAFGYDYSSLHHGDYFLTQATFKLRNATDLETAFARGRQKEIIRHRERRYPTSHTCGSFFRNFHDHEVHLKSNGKKIIFVAYYLDKIGVKGHLSVGDAIVSYQHANMLVNRGNATSTDIVELAKKMQSMVIKEFGIIPQAECQLLGFKKAPLL